jgi:predicted membrane protein
MKTIIENPGIHHNRRTTIGAIILVIGSLLLIDQLNISFIPDWIFSWPMILIAIGVYSGVKHHFTKPIAAILIFLGVAFLFSENIDNADRIVWPIAIIATGTWMVLRHKKPVADTPYKESSFKEL